MHYLLSFILAMVVTMAGLPLLVRLAGRWNILDLPGGRKVHTTPTPRVGGLAMACGVAAAALLTMHLEGPDRWFLLAADVLVAFGAWDDWADLDYRIKLAGQLLAICIVVVLGDVQIRTITLDDSIALPGWVSAPLTIFFLVGITNAINLADGLDGLAGGTTFFCLCAVALLSSAGESGTSTAMALAFAGAVLGFLRFNTYPASVFMGDAGSQLLGFAIGVLSIRATQDGTSQISAAIPLLLLALPILDTLNVMTQRIGEGRSPFSADKNHIHHKLLALGFDHHEAVMVIYAVQGALFVAAYFLRFESDLLILGITIAFFAVSISIFRAAVRTGWKFRVKAPIETPAAQFMDALQQPQLLPRLTKTAIAVALASYAVLIVAETSALSGDSANPDRRAPGRDRRVLDHHARRAARGGRKKRAFRDGDGARVSGGRRAAPRPAHVGPGLGRRIGGGPCDGLPAAALERPPLPGDAAGSHRAVHGAGRTEPARDRAPAAGRCTRDREADHRALCDRNAGEPHG